MFFPIRCDWSVLEEDIARDVETIGDGSRYSVSFKDGSATIRHGKDSVIGTVRDNVRNEEAEFFLVIWRDGGISVHDKRFEMFRLPAFEVGDLVDTLIAYLNYKTIG